jgi:hypothetical protein
MGCRVALSETLGKFNCGFGEFILLLGRGAVPICHLDVKLLSPLNRARYMSKRPIAPAAKTAPSKRAPRSKSDKLVFYTLKSIRFQSCILFFWRLHRPSDVFGDSGTGTIHRSRRVPLPFAPHITPRIQEKSNHLRIRRKIWANTTRTSFQKIIVSYIRLISQISCLGYSNWIPQMKRKNISRDAKARLFGRRVPLWDG